jgi:hypothetical protein
MSRQLLSGWKEISRHIGRSVRTVQRWEPRLGMPVYGTTLKNRSAVVAFSDELDCWISRASPAREEDAVLNNEIVLQVLKDMAPLVGNISGLASQMQLWPEPSRSRSSFTILRRHREWVPARHPWQTEARASCWPFGPGRPCCILTAWFSEQTFGA